MNFMNNSENNMHHQTLVRTSNEGVLLSHEHIREYSNDAELGAYVRQLSLSWGDLLKGITVTNINEQ